MTKIPHYSDNPEETLLGAVMIENKALYSAVGIIEPTDFEDPRNATIYEAMLSLAEKAQPIDPVTLKTALGSDNFKLVGASYVAGLMDGVPRITNAEPWARIIRDRSIMRALRKHAKQIPSLIDEADTALAAVDAVQESLSEAVRSKTVTGFMEPEKSLSLGLRYIEDFVVATKDGKRLGVATGLPTLDDVLFGMEPGQMIVLAAKTGMGKTSFAVQIGEHAASEGQPVAFFSLEMTRRQIEMRRLVARSRYPLSEIRRIEQGIHEGFEPPEKRDQVWSAVAQAFTKLAKAPFYICDDTHQTVLGIRTECTRLAMQEGPLGLVIIDYLQYMQADTSKRGDTREREVAALAQGLKAISKDLGVPVLALSQLSRAGDKRSDPRPMLSDLRDSGQVEQEADAVLFLYTDEDLDAVKPGEMVRSEVIVAKQRNGQTGVVNVWWDRELFRYDDPSWHAIDKEEA